MLHMFFEVSNCPEDSEDNANPICFVVTEIGLEKTSERSLTINHTVVHCMTSSLGGRLFSLQSLSILQPSSSYGSQQATVR